MLDPNGQAYIPRRHTRRELLLRGELRVCRARRMDYDDPLTRYYGILDGLFAKATVLCESDGDCTYYRAVMDTIGSLHDGTPVDSLDLHFTHCAGKSRLPAAVKTLRSAGASVVCVADIDMLRDDVDFARLIEAAGGSVDSFTKARNVVKAAVESKGSRPERVAIRSEIVEILDQSTSRFLSSNEVDKIREAVSKKGGWHEMKRYGRESLSGDARAAFDSMWAELRKIGILLVPVGELESFQREHTNQNKAAWLAKVLAEKRYGENTESVDFVTAILETSREQQIIGHVDDPSRVSAGVRNTETETPTHLRAEGSD